MLEGKLSAFEHFCRHQGEKLLSATQFRAGKASRTPEEILQQAWNRIPEEQQNIYEYCASLIVQNTEGKFVVSPYDEKENEVLDPHGDVPVLSQDSNEIDKRKRLHVSTLKSARPEASSPTTAAVRTLELEDHSCDMSLKQAAGPNGLCRGSLLFRPSALKLTDYWTVLGIEKEGHNERNVAAYESSHPVIARRCQERKSRSSTALPTTGIPALADAKSAYDFFVLDYYSALKHPDPNDMEVSTAWDLLGEIERQKYENQRDEALARRELEENGEALTVRKLRRSNRINETTKLPLSSKKRKSDYPVKSRKRNNPSRRCESSIEATISTQPLKTGHVEDANTVVNSGGAANRSLSTDQFNEVAVIAMEKSNNLLNKSARFCRSPRRIAPHSYNGSSTTSITEIKQQSRLLVTQTNTEKKDTGNIGHKICSVANVKTTGRLRSYPNGVNETTQALSEEPSISLEESPDPPLQSFREKQVNSNPVSLITGTIAANIESPPQLCERINCTYDTNGTSKALRWNDEHRRPAMRSEDVPTLEENYAGDETQEKLSMQDDKKLHVDKTDAVTMEADALTRKKVEKENFVSSTAEAESHRIAVCTLPAKVYQNAAPAPSAIFNCSDELTERNQKVTSSMEPAIDSLTVSTNNYPLNGNSTSCDEDSFGLDELAILTCDVEDGRLCDGINFGEELDVNAVVKLNCHELRQLLHCTTDDVGLFLP